VRRGHRGVAADGSCRDSYHLGLTGTNISPSPHPPHNETTIYASRSSRSPFMNRRLRLILYLSLPMVTQTSRYSASSRPLQTFTFTRLPLQHSNGQCLNAAYPVMTLAECVQRRARTDTRLALVWLPPIARKGPRLIRGRFAELCPRICQAQWSLSV
jgi:hypothetical protein